MRASLLKETIKSTFPIQRTLCIEGSPGGGKTTIVHQVAEELDLPVIERHMPTMLVEDFGILFPKESGGLEYKLPDWFPVKGKAPDKGILLFDDRNQANADLQKVLANI
jgi:MoxR-like ATPase